MLHLSTSCRYYLYQEPVHIHSGFDRLSGIVSAQMMLPATDGSIFIFLNKKRNQVKLLHWEEDGFSLYHKRLERGTYELPVTQQGSTRMNITAQQLLDITAYSVPLVSVQSLPAISVQIVPVLAALIKVFQSKVYYSTKE